MADVLGGFLAGVVLTLFAAFLYKKVKESKERKSSSGSGGGGGGSDGRELHRK